MASTSTHITPLPTEFTPAKSSTELLIEFVERRRDAGVLQKTLALALGFGPNYISMLKAGEDLPMSRVDALAAALHLTDAEAFELKSTRLIEMHGRKGEFCFESVAAWGHAAFAPAGDEALLVDMWNEACSPAPAMVSGLLKDPAVAARVRAVLEMAVQAELQARADDAAGA